MTMLPSPVEDRDTVKALLSADTRRVLVLDDDPTGSQAASDVDVILRADTEAIREWLRGGERGLYLVTNSRSMAADRAVELLRGIRTMVGALCLETGHEVSYVLRGDSTLRGHVFEESAVFEEPGGILLFCPAFPQGGRFTLGGVQYVRTAGRAESASETEFARDPVFAYRSSALADWVAERGWARPVVSVALASLRSGGAQGFADVLLHAAAGSVVIPDCETDSDVSVVTSGLLVAERCGRKITVRCAATLAAARIGSAPKRISSIPMHGRRILVVCGSHTQGSTRQLAGLTGKAPEPIQVTTEMAFSRPGRLAEIGGQVRRRLEQDGVAVLATERSRRPEHNQLRDGAAVMEALTDVVADVRDSVDACIVKGGITSAEVAERGLGSWRGRVLGQLEPGVSAWRLRTMSGRVVPYVVVPGNVGDDGTLVRCLEALIPEGDLPPGKTTGNGSVSAVDTGF